MLFYRFIRSSSFPYKKEWQQFLDLQAIKKYDEKNLHLRLFSLSNIDL